MELNKEELLSLYEQEQNKTLVAKEYCEKHGIEYSDSVRRRVSKIINNNSDNEEITTNTSKTSDNDYKSSEVFVLSAYDEKKNRILTIEEYCDKYNLDFSSISSYKFLPYHYKFPSYNIVFKENTIDNDNFLEDVVMSKIDNLITNGIELPSVSKNYESNNEFDVCVITDVHVGMSPNPNGFSLYGGQWDRAELFRRGDILLNHLIKTKKSENLIFFDLGDYLDGWDGETVRKGHKLPQNMTNEEAFDCAFDFKLWLITKISAIYKNVEFVNIVDDNHSGSFSYVTNRPLKTYVENTFENVKFVIQRKFISHYIYGNKCFIATHGKDGVNLKFGFKPVLDTKQIEKIDNYINEYDLNKYDIYFIKGDSHQDIFDNSTAQNFKYWNFPAFSPSSNWVQTNFKKGVSGFYTINFTESDYNLNPKYFKWSK